MPWWERENWNRPPRRNPPPEGNSLPEIVDRNLMMFFGGPSHLFHPVDGGYSLNGRFYPSPLDEDGQPMEPVRRKYPALTLLAHHNVPAGTRVKAIVLPNGTYELLNSDGEIFWSMPMPRRNIDFRLLRHDE